MKGEVDSNAFELPLRSSEKEEALNQDDISAIHEWAERFQKAYQIK